MQGECLIMNHRGVAVDLILLGCVRQKRDEAGPAQDVYDSTLWKYRRRYAESRGCPWYILSAKHGLLAPEDCIEPYDTSMADIPTTGRRTWSKEVLNALKVNFPELEGKTIEIHAGKLYVEYGLEKGLSEAGVVIYRPLANIRGHGLQFNWYKDNTTSSP